MCFVITMLALGGLGYAYAFAYAYAYGLCLWGYGCRGYA
jgi:hypothetical protein